MENLKPSGSSTFTKQKQCRPMPITDTTGYKPDWMSQPLTGYTRTYPAPSGVTITPISKGGRFGDSSDGKGSNWLDEKKKSTQPKVDKDKECPVVKPTYPGEKAEENSGILSKICTLFGGSKGSASEGESNNKMDDFRLSENSVVVLRKDNYFCPLFVNCAPAVVPPLPDLNCDCDDCKEQAACSECKKWAKETMKSCDKSPELNNSCPDPCKPPVICTPEPEPVQECIEEIVEEECEELEIECGEVEEECVDEDIECMEEPECVDEEQECIECVEEEPIECPEEPKCDCGCEEVKAPPPPPKPEIVCCTAVYCYEIPELKFIPEETVKEPATMEIKEEIPATETTEAPATETTEAPAMETTEAPAMETTEAPATETTETPAIEELKTEVTDTTSKSKPTSKTCKPAKCKPSRKQGPKPLCTKDLPKADDDGTSRQNLEFELRSKLLCLEPKDTEEILQILKRVPEKCEKPVVVVVPEDPILTAENEVYVKAQEMLETECTCNLCKPVQPEPPDFLPEPDCRDVSVRAQELLEKSCDCGKCNGCGCVSVTCGECGSIRGENSDSCIMCRFSLTMAQEKEYMRNVMCIEPCPLWEDAAEDCKQKIDEDAKEFEFRNGKPVYEGGMSLNRCEKFLWDQSICDGEGFKAYAVKGQTLRENSDDPECTCEEHMKKLKYKGGMTLDERQEWLWIKNKNPTIEK